MDAWFRAPLPAALVRRPLGKSKQRGGYFSQRPAHGQWRPCSSRAPHSLELAGPSPRCHALARAGLSDIDRVGEAIKPAKRSRIHTFIATSPVHMKWKLQMEPQRAHHSCDCKNISGRTSTQTSGTVHLAGWPAPTILPNPLAAEAEGDEGCQ
jgi:hypothetical protein